MRENEQTSSTPGSIGSKCVKMNRHPVLQVRSVQNA
jgi:hypothetical protein